MFAKTRYAMMAAAAVAGLLLASVAGLLAQDATPPAPQQLKVGVVDLDTISEQYKELISRQNELRDWAQARAKYVEELKNYMFLSEQNFAEIVQLLEVPRAKWTDPQKKREDELRKVSEQKEKRFLDLQAKTDRAPGDEDEFNTLAETYDTRRADITKRATAIEQEYLNKRADAQMSLASSVREIIVGLAQEQKYDLVLDSATVFYSSEHITDLTPAVIEKLNKPAEG